MEKRIRKERLVRSLGELSHLAKLVNELHGGAHRDLAAKIAFHTESIRDILLIKSPIALAREQRTSSAGRAVRPRVTGSRAGN